MGYITSSDGQSYIRLQTSVTTNQLYTVPTSYLSFGYGADVFFFSGEGFYTPAFLSDPMRCIDVVSCSNDGEDSIAKEIDYRTVKPVNHDWDPAEDWRRYGSLFGIASRLSGPIDPVAHLREKEVSHPSYIGVVEDLTDFEYHEVLNGTHMQWGNAIEIPLYSPTYIPTNRHHLRATGFSDNGFLSFTEGEPIGSPLVHSFGGDAWDVAVLLCDHLSVPGNEAFWTSGYWKFTVRDFTGTYRKTYNRWHLECDYEYEMRFGVGPFVTAKFRTTAKHDIGYRPALGSNNPFESNRIPESVFFATSNSSVEKLSVDWPTDLIDHVEVVDAPGPSLKWGESYGYATTQLYTRPYQSEGYLQDKFTVYRKFDSSDPKRRHELMSQRVIERMPAIRPSSFYSASAALEEFVGVIKANHVENLSQLSGLLKLLPDLAPLARIAAKAVKGDPSAIKDLIDVITDAILAFRFAVAPTGGDAAELARADIQKELDKLLRPQTTTIYGKFEWEFPDEHNFTADFDGQLVLETRSKVRVHLDMSTLLVNLLTANSVGLLPTLSRVWESLPFTFVVDWFTNMDDRLAAVDNQLLWAVIRTDWCLHSYSVIYYPSPAELALYGLKTVEGDDRFGIKMYLREFTRCTPVLRDSKYDFLSPTNGPDPVTVGSLVWQAI